MRPSDALPAVYLCRDVVDFRKGINGLAILVEEVLQHDPFSEQLFVFCNRKCDKIKILYWERNGFCLWQKRLERARFKWPRRVANEVVTLNGQQLKVSDIYDPDRAAVSTGNLKSLAESDGWSSLGDIVKRADRIRGYGDFYQYHLLAAGKVDAVIESDVNILDIAALSASVTEAGGVFTNLHGEKPDLEICSVLAANPSLHEKYLTQLKGHVS